MTTGSAIENQSQNIRLARLRAFFKNPRMGSTSNTPKPNVPARVWDPNVILPIIGDPVRWRILLALARGGPQPASKLKEIINCKRDNTIKQLLTLCKAGLVVDSTDPTDRRRQIYRLSPDVTIRKTEKGWALDFGVCTLPF